MQNGVLRCFDISTSECKVLEQLDIGCAVTSLNWSPNYRTLVLGSSKVGITKLIHVQWSPPCLKFIIFQTSHYFKFRLYRQVWTYVTVCQCIAVIFPCYLGPVLLIQRRAKITGLHCNHILVIRDSQVLAKLVVVTIFFIGWGQTARLQRVRQNTADRIQTETEQQQTVRLQRVRQNTADRILKFDKRYKAFEIAGYFRKHREIIG